MRRLGRCYYPVCSTRAGHVLARTLVSSVRRLGGLRRFQMPLDALDLDHAALAGLTDLWSRIHWSAGDGMMPPDQLLAVYRLATTWPGDGDTVELGSWVGLTTSYLATACRVRGRGTVYAVDTFEGTQEGGGHYPSVARYGGSTRGAFDRQVRESGIESHVRVLVGDTREVAHRYPGRPIRLLLIDADHSYEGVRADFDRWSDHIEPGGLIIFHDYLMPEVARFVDGEVLADDRFKPSPGHVVPNVFAVERRRPSRVATPEKTPIRKQEPVGVPL